jgi:hypothetical protein
MHKEGVEDRLHAIKLQQPLYDAFGVRHGSAGSAVLRGRGQARPLSAQGAAPARPFSAQAFPSRPFSAHASEASKLQRQRPRSAALAVTQHPHALLSDQLPGPRFDTQPSHRQTSRLQDVHLNRPKSARLLSSQAYSPQPSYQRWPSSAVPCSPTRAFASHITQLNCPLPSMPT